MKRIFLFIVTNLAIVFVLSITLRILGVDQILNAQGTGLNINALLIFAAVIGFGGSFISLMMSKWSARFMTGAQVIESPTNATETWLLETVKRQAEKVGIGMPEVAIYDSPDANAFATGARRNHALVAVSSGLLNQMNKEQIEGVLGHEMTHVANGDMITLALIQGVVNTFVIFLSRVVGYLVDRIVFKTERGQGPAFWITSMAAQLVLGVLATMIVMWFSRYREFRADAGSAKLEGREKMISALQRLKQNYETPHLPERIAAFGISGNAGNSLTRLFMSHPPLDERIVALQKVNTSQFLYEKNSQT